MSQWVKGVGSTNFGNMDLRPDELEKISSILAAGLAAVKPGESSRDRIQKIINFGRGAKAGESRSVISDTPDLAIIRGSDDAYFDEVDQDEPTSPESLVSFVATVPSKDMLVEFIQDSFELAA